MPAITPALKSKVGDVRVRGDFGAGFGLMFPSSPGELALPFAPGFRLVGVGCREMLFWGDDEDGMEDVVGVISVAVEGIACVVVGEVLAGCGGSSLFTGAGSLPVFPNLSGIACRLWSLRWFVWELRRGDADVEETNNRAIVR